jgi:hypothetical protein
MQSAREKTAAVIGFANKLSTRKEGDSDEAVAQQQGWLDAAGQLIPKDIAFDRCPMASASALMRGTSWNVTSHSP